MTLSGSTVNVIVSEARTETEGVGFGFFEFALTGVPLVVLTMLVCVAFGRRLLPHRLPDESSPDVSGHADTLVEHYTLEQGFFRLAVPAGSDLVGTALEQLVVPHDHDDRDLGPRNPQRSRGRHVRARIPHRDRALTLDSPRAEK